MLYLFYLVKLVKSGSILDVVNAKKTINGGIEHYAMVIYHL